MFSSIKDVFLIKIRFDCFFYKLKYFQQMMKKISLMNPIQISLTISFWIRNIFFLNSYFLRAKVASRVKVVITSLSSPRLTKGRGGTRAIIPLFMGALLVKEGSASYARPAIPCRSRARVRVGPRSPILAWAIWDLS